MAFDGRNNIIDIDDEEKIVTFDTWKPKKITGHRIGAILGYNELSTPFKIACEIAGIYPGDPSNKYIVAGNVIEPIIREYCKRTIESIRESVGVPDAVIDDPAPPQSCGYDHFHNEKLFGGMVDGYISSKGKRFGILEIKTASNREKWLDDQGGYTNVPMSYILQAGLYAKLSAADIIVFAVGFLEEDDYRVPAKWTPTKDNFLLITMKTPEMDGYMKDAEDWYNEYIKCGVTPEWTDKDEELLKYLKAKPNKNSKQTKFK